MSKIKKEEILTTSSLTMHCLLDSDLENAISLLDNKIIKKTFMLPTFKNKEEVIRLFKRLQHLSQENEHFVYGIYLNEQLIGIVNDVESDSNSMELGYLIHPNYHNQGYATEMLEMAIQTLFKRGYTTIKAGFFEENEASKRVMEKCGMHRIDYTEDIEYQNQTHHCIYYAIRKDEKDD